MEQTDTPRTDEEMWTTDYRHDLCNVVNTEFAQQLERELAASQAEVKSVEKISEARRKSLAFTLNEMNKLEAEIEFWKAKAYEAEHQEGKHEAEVERLNAILRTYRIPS